MELVGQLIRSIEREDDGPVWDAALAAARRDPAMWRFVKPTIIDPEAGTVRVSVSRETGEPVAVTRHSPAGEGRIWRTVAVLRPFWGRPESDEVSWLELRHAFTSGIHTVQYAVPRGHQATLVRGSRLGWKPTGQREDLLLFSLNAEDFITHLLANGMRHVSGGV